MNDINYNRLEKREAKKDGATLVSNSGRGNAKGDAKWDDYLFDYKFNKKSFSLSLKNWLKHKKDAWEDNHREPIIKIIFEDQTKLVIIDYEIFKEMRDGRKK
jgi:hypothetical protein